MNRTAPHIALLATALVAIGTFAGAHSPTQAATTTTTVTNVLDGDTFNAEVFGEVQKVRMIGINATEIGTCHSEEATQWLEDRIEGREVQLTAEDPLNTLGGGRPGRFVDMDGTDIGAEMLTLGLVTPFPNFTERARNSTYVQLALEARIKGIGVWNDTACGSGPAQSAGLRLEVRWDADGDDHDNVNGEWIDVYNPSTSDVSLDGWNIRDPRTRFFDFPNDSVVRAESYLRVHVGTGTDTATDIYWGLSGPILSNDLEESIYLFDPDGDLRDSFEYTCRYECVNHYTDLSLGMNFDAEGDDTLNPNGEWIDVVNSGSERIDLYGLYIDTYPFSYHFEPEHSVAPGSRLRIFIGQGTDSDQELYFGKDEPILNNTAETVTLHRKDGLLLERLVWPNPFVSCTYNADAGSSNTEVCGSTSGSLELIDQAATATVQAVRISHQ